MQLAKTAKYVDTTVDPHSAVAICRTHGLLGQDTAVVVDFAPRNIEPLLALAAIAAETGRRLLVHPRDTYLLMAITLAYPGREPCERKPAY